MKPRSHICKTLNWTGAAITLLLIALWIVSATRPYHCYWSTHHTLTFLLPCCLNIEWRGGYTDNFLLRHDTYTRSRLTLCFTYENNPSGAWLTISLATLTLLAALCTLLAWRADTIARRRACIGFCPKCNYDRTGLAPRARCPECGSAGAEPTPIPT